LLTLYYEQYILLNYPVRTKRAIIETINNELKSSAQTEHYTFTMYEVILQHIFQSFPKVIHLITTNQKTFDFTMKNGSFAK